MSARLLQRPTMRGPWRRAWTGRVAPRLLSAASTPAYTCVARLVDAPPLGRRAVVAVAVIAVCAIPLYESVAPGVHPERCRRGRVRRPRHRAGRHEPRAPWTTSMQADRDGVQHSPRRATGAGNARRRASSAASTRADLYVRLAPHEERIFSLGPALARDRAARAVRGVPGQLLAARRDGGDPPAPAQASRTCAFSVRNMPVVQPRRRPSRHRLRHPRSGADALRRLRARSCARRRREVGVLDADITLKLEQARAARRRSTASAPPTSASTTEDIATALRIMVGGDDEVSRFRDSSVNEDYDVQLRLANEDRNDPANASRGCYVPRDDRRAGAPGQPGQHRATPRAPSRIDRLDRQRQVDAARRRRARLRAGRPHRRRCAGRPRN